MNYVSLRKHMASPAPVVAKRKLSLLYSKTKTSSRSNALHATIQPRASNSLPKKPGHTWLKSLVSPEIKETGRLAGTCLRKEGAVFGGYGKGNQYPERENCIKKSSKRKNPLRFVLTVDRQCDLSDLGCRPIRGSHFGDVRSTM